jgi:gas vesicle protein
MNERDFPILGVILAFAGGAIAGAATALLLAPMSGSETRGNIKRFAVDTKDRLATKAGSIKLPFRKHDDLDLPIQNGGV